MHKGSGSEHATAVLVGPTAILIRGPSGAGKSRLAWSLLEAAREKKILFARLVADDRVALSVINASLIASVPKAIAGMIELRGDGIRRVPHEAYARVGLIVDLDAEDGARMPEEVARKATILGVTLPRLPVAKGADPLPLVLSKLGGTGDSGG